MDKIIMGMDPGTNIMGYGIIQVRKSEMKILQYGVIHLSKYRNHELKLKTIFERTLSKRFLKGLWD
jgi:crossover junction endodeoxyribonuclease RuvC